LKRAAQLGVFALALLTLAAVAAFVAKMAGALDPPGTPPLALDFDAFWTAARIACAQGARFAYDNRVVEAFERAHTTMTAPGYLAFYYPPSFLLLCLPLAALPYAGALLVFEAVQAALLLPALKRILDTANGNTRWGWLPVLAAPGFTMNVFSGQNGGLSAACLAGAMLTLERNPWLGGACLGLLSCKPQLAACVPVALLAARRWRAALAAAITAAMLALAATLVLGPGAWQGFLGNAPAARHDIETIAMKWPMMQSFYAGIRMAGFPAWAAYAGQAVIAPLALALLVSVCWRRPGRAGRDLGTPLGAGPELNAEPELSARPELGAGAEMAALSATALLVTPFLYDYDLVLLTVPIAWVAGDAARRGWLAGERAVVLACYLAPLAARACGLELGITVGPPLVLALLVVVARRASAPSPGAEFAPAGLADPGFAGAK
jgi:alpha-1,2-mannosyltransferase